MKPVTIPGPLLGIGEDTCAVLSFILRRELETVRRDCLKLPPDVLENFEAIVATGEAAIARAKGEVSNSVSNIDDSGFKPIQWTTMKLAAEELDISTQMVGRLLRSGQLHGEQEGRSWRVNAGSVAARKEATS